MVGLGRCASRLFIAVVCVSSAFPLQAEDWYCWRGPTLDGISTETDWSDSWPVDGPSQLWKTNVGTGFSSVAVSHNRLFTLGNTNDVDTIFCLDALTGKELWKYSYDAPLDDRFFEGGPTSTPTVDGEVVYVLSRQGDLFCLHRDDGKVRWSKNVAEETGAPVPGWGFSGSPVVRNKLLLLNVGEAGTAVNKLTGDIVWHSAASEAGYMTPLPIRHQNLQLVVIASGRQYSGVDVATGEVKWQHRWLTTFGCNAADPIAKGTQVFISSGYNRGSALLEMTAGSPTVVWSNKEFQNQFSSSVLLGDYLFGVDGNDTAEQSFKCVEFATGKIAWTHKGLGAASLMAAGDRLIILSGSGELVIASASPKSFEPRARCQAVTGKCWTVPVLSNGRIYCRSASGELVCLEVRQHRSKVNP